MKKQTIRLTESELKNFIKESVTSILKESSNYNVKKKYIKGGIIMIENSKGAQRAAMMGIGGGQQNQQKNLPKGNLTQF